jgi:hypothetical protein
MPDSGKLGVLTIREPQVLALQKLNPIIKIDYINTKIIIFDLAKDRRLYKEQLL